MLNQKIANKFIDNIVSVDWLDIVSEIKADKYNILKVDTKNLLTKCTSYGKLVKCDKTGIILMSEDSMSQIDYTVIPYGNIVNIQKYNLKGGKNGKRR